MPDDSHYIHGTEPEEQERLSRLNGLLNHASLRELALQGGERILDVGCGLGQFTLAAARAAGPTGFVLGTDNSAEQLAQARRQVEGQRDAAPVEFREGDARKLPLRPDEWGTFDLVHTRFLLEHVPDPLAVVREMVRAVRPGGRIALADDPHDVMRLWPEPPGFAPLWAAYIRSYDRLGNDPHVGLRLVQLLHQAGAEPLRNTWIFFGSCAGRPDFGDYVDNLIGVLQTAREAMVTGALLTEPEFDSAIAALRDWCRRPDAALWFAMAWAEGVKPL
jgi:SAM-dependent methyltransferase